MHLVLVLHFTDNCAAGEKADFSFGIRAESTFVRYSILDVF